MATSNAVYEFIKKHTESYVIEANSWYVGANGIKYKEMDTIASLIGANKIVLGAFITWMSGLSEPINVILDVNMTRLYLTAASQNAKASRLDVTIIYY